MALREERYEEALAECAVYDSDLRMWRSLSEAWVDEIVPAVMAVADEERERYRLAWISARQRAADEANMSMEALDHIRADRDRWRAGHETAESQLVHARRENQRLRAELEQREPVHAPRLEYAGEDEDGEVFRLA